MREIPVSRLCKGSVTPAMVVHQDTPLEQVIGQFVGDHTLSSIFLVDDSHRLVGVVDRHRLLNWARLRFNLAGQMPQLRLTEMRRLVLATRACDIATVDGDQLAVRREDSLADALERMARHDLVDIPVVDERGRIVDSLRLSEVLACAFQAEA